jgi:hypothetical protein
MSLTQADIQILSAPFDEKTIGVKVQSTSRDKTKALLVAYLQHTDVYARIEKVDPAWTAEVTAEEWKGEYCFVRVRMTIKGVSRENSGEGETPKSATSDAFKRAAMLFGVGRYLYDSETVWVPYNDSTDRYKTYTMADYKRGLKPGQDPLPTTEREKQKAAVHSSETSRPTAALKETKKPMTRAELGSEIMKVAETLKLPQNVLKSWVEDDFKKPVDKLTDGEMGQFLETLLFEVGRKGN